MNINEAQLPKGYDINSADEVTCDQCDSNVFETIVALKKMPAKLSPTGKDAVIPVPVFRCASCKYLNKNFLK